MPDHPFDTNRRLRQDSAGLVPDGDSTKAGFRLTWVGPGPLDFDWVQDSDREILKGVGSPDGVVFAPKSTLYQERDEPGVWQNTDGLDAWTQLGAATPTPVAAVSGNYATGDPVITSVPDGVETNLEWTTFTVGTDVLDLSDPLIPTVLTDGAYTFDVTTQGAAAFALQILLIASDGGVPYFGGSTDTTDDGNSHTSHLTAALHAGSTFEIHAVQNTGISRDVSVLGVNVTRIS